MTAITVTVNVTPPPGSLLVLMIAANGSSSVETMTVSGGGLNWIEKVKANASGQQYAGVWVADIPVVNAPAPVVAPGAATTRAANW
jgi:hypothetical protein